VVFQAEVSTLAEPAFARLLLRRGYELRGYENLLGCRLGERNDPPSVPNVSVRVVDPAENDFSPWVDLLVTGFLSADLGGVGGDVTPAQADAERWCRLSALTPGMRCYAARLNGTLAGGGVLFMADGVAILCGASTLPAFRRRGVQTTVLRTRLQDAQRAGCEYAIVTVQPGSKSHQNVQREGFSLLYSRALLVKEPA
jgi:hypothetical protein